MQQTAYLSAEIGYAADVPSYAGGLGVLAGDHLKSAADLGLPVVAVTLLYREGYFVQHLDPDGNQLTSYPRFDPESRLQKVDAEIEVQIGGRNVHAAIWRHDLIGRSGKKIPILLLDSDHEENHPDDRRITHRLYGGDKGTRLRQEMILGFGGVAAVRALFPDVARFHLNEGHCAFAMLALLREGMSLAEVRQAGHFTTHTPVPAGHDTFPYPLVRECFGALFNELGATIPQLAGRAELSMSHLALNTCGTANAVSALHGEVSRAMFPEHDIGHVTNGVHHLTWVAPQLARLYDQHARGWRDDPQVLARAGRDLPAEALWQAHLERKREMLAYVGAYEARGYGEELLTIGFARRATAYKRAELIFSDLDRLARIGAGRLQLVFAGKAHPMDGDGQATIRRIVAAGRALAGQVRVSYMPNYTMWSGALLTSGTDVWLNTPRRPREASGTSGMKAILNGVPNASIADGWWAEGGRHGENGWVIDGSSSGDADQDGRDADALYELLEHEILPAWENRARWLELMRGAVTTGPAFSSERMVKEYSARYYT